MTGGSTDLETTLDVAFECVGNPTGLKRSDLVHASTVRVERIVGSTTRPAIGTVRVSARQCLLVISRTGSLIGRTAPRQPVSVIPATSVALIPPGDYGLVAGRGDHTVDVIRVDMAPHPIVEHAVRGLLGTSGIAKTLHCRSIEGLVSGSVARFDRLMERGTRSHLELLSVVYELVALTSSAEMELTLATLPIDLPETIVDLTKRVKASSNSPWPLKLAADLAGYSPFHFSRVFKQLVGYGFHEYVDRRRTEVAVEQLIRSDVPVDAIASSCGFGTTQGLRESLKEYLGLVPSELRPPDLSEGNRNTP